MDWVARLGRIGVLAGAAGAAACGRTVTPASPGSLRPAAACSQPARLPSASGTTGAPACRLTLAIADEADQGSDSERLAGVRALLSEIATALPAQMPLPLPMPLAQAPVPAITARPRRATHRPVILSWCIGSGSLMRGTRWTRTLACS